ncbi:DUF11 domain-containing protein [Ferruginibacter lapsinanis]|uniref:SdrD B-like domain-containing protein n=1 Tax=Ferruginibacter lapsinanis TaxID=563172 RepID=UPI001E5F9E0E|nr:SdrD B-like domain-containing protein [Ferruginibacter lapsinanis]UEG48879.1 DUF11 domain-containing protein [Ferruginibacter lapsinanis]
MKQTSICTAVKRPLFYHEIRLVIIFSFMLLLPSMFAVSQTVDIGVAKTVSDATPDENQAIAYTITITNAGPANASNVVIQDILPSGVTFVSSSATQGTYDVNTGLWTLGSINKNAVKTLTLNVTVNSGTSMQTISNTASLNAVTQTDASSANNSATANLTVNGADLSLTTQVNKSSAMPGNTVTYTVTVTNNGPLASNDVQIQDILPAGLTYVSSSATESSYNSATQIWGGTNLDLAIGETRTLTINATVNAGTLGTIITNTASITTATQPDSYTSNNSSSAFTVIGNTDLSISSTVSNPFLSEGDPVVYTVTVTNNGPYTAAPFLVTDVLPSQLNYVSSSATLGSYNATTGVWSSGTSTLSSVSGSNTAVLTINATVKSNTATFRVSNTANLTVTQSGNTLSNDTTTTSFQINGADLQLAITSSNAAPAEGQAFNYTITITNNGPNAVANTSVSTQLAVGLNYVSAVASKGTYSNATGNWTGINLVNGESTTLTLTVSFQEAKTIVTTASILSSSELDATTSNNTASVTVAGYKNFKAGACIINMGITPQTYNNGLRPYGLVYNLVRAYKVPVYWAVNPNKSFVTASSKVDQVDFTVGATSYKGGAFIIPSEYVPFVQTFINSWVTAYPGLTVNFNQPAFTAPVYNYITSFPNAVLDLQNGTKIRDAFYLNAGIPDSSYRLGTPADLINCDDIYAMPHADPQSWTLASGYGQTLKNFVASGGYLWAACHSASALESLVDLNGDTNPDLNFLSNAGLVPWTDHTDGTPPYSYSTSQGFFNPQIASDPFMQFMGTLDGALQNGSEQIYIPYSAGWRSTTKIAIYDNDHPQVTSGTYAPGPAALVAYGRGFGSASNGMVLYEASHTIAGGTEAENVAAARIYGNFLLNAGVERRPEFYNFSVPDSIETLDTANVSVNIARGTPAYSILWTSSNGGSFLNAQALSTKFVAPNVTVVTDFILRVTVTDACGRINFRSKVIRVYPILYGSIGDKVWDDQNGNGVQDVGEPGLSGVSVTITRQSNGVTSSTTTNASGVYSFSNLRQGTYNLSFTTPSGYIAATANAGADDTKDSDPVSGVISGIVLTPGQNDSTADAGFQSTNLNLGKFVWDDQNNNGVQDVGEPFISGATVNLYRDADADNVPDGAAVSTTTTSAGGVYAFTGLTPGNYIVGVVIPAGYTRGTTTATSTSPNNDDNTDNNGVTTAGGEVRSNYISLVSSNEPTTDGDGSNGNLTLGVALKGTGSIGDLVWDDQNNNGIQDTGEPGLSGVVVTLTYPNNSTINTTTDANGGYTFSNLAPGTYSLAFATPSGFSASTANVGGNDLKDSDPIGGVVTGIVLTAGQLDTTVDAAFACIGIHTSALQTACETYNWHGIDYTTSGSYIYNYLSGTGCPSTDTLHLIINYGTHNALTQTACESYNWHGTDYTTSGDYTYSYTNGSGCASVDTLHLTVNYGTHNATTQTACESYNWHGTDYAVSGDYTYSYTNGSGCASVDTLHLTVNYGTHNATTETACESYNWHGTDYAVSGDYTYSYTNGSGCASVDTLHLTVNYGTHNATTETACESYNWHGTDYTASGDYTYSYTNWSGCASVDTLHLTVNYGTHNATTETACETYNWHGTDYAVSGDYTYSYTNGSGCASVDTLHLTVNYGTHNATTETACETYNWHGADYTASGDYIYSYTNGSGCASVDTLHLTVNYGTHNATTETACETYNWHGTDYTASGDYTYSYTNGSGCASVDTLHLTVNYGTHNATTETACEIYNWHGTDYAASGDYTYSYTNWSGCASVDTLHLTVNYGTHNATTETACETYSWHGTDYTASGDYTYSYTNGSGCASVDTLHLTVNYGTHNATTETACETYNWHGTDYTASGDYTYSYTNGSGCASVDTLHLTVNYGTHNATTQTACESYNWHGTDYTASGDYTYSYTNGSGCASVDTLHLTINNCSSIGDVVWNDQNGNGLQDVGEPGIPGVTVILTYPNNATVSTTTDANGGYTFSNLASGTYSLTFTTPAGFAPTSSNQGGDNSLDSDPVNGVVNNILLSASQSMTTVDAGFYTPFGSIGDKVWNDANKNGIQEPAEAGMAGVAISLLDNSGAVVSTTTTDATGNYVFENVPVALSGTDYQVQFGLPSLYKFSPEGEGNDRSADSDPNTTTGKTKLITLSPGDKFKSDVDAGMYTIASILPVKFVNLDGVNKSSEVQLKWVAITDQGFKHFEIEYSTDGISYTKIATVSGVSTPNEKNSYSFVHTSPSAGTNYYRLKSVDINGAFIYSNSIAVRVGVTIGIVNAYPNPFTDRIDINFQSQLANSISIRMVDISGRAIRSMTGKVNSGNNHLVVGNLSNLPPGTYVLEIIDLTDNAAYRYKLIKQ